MRGSRRKKEEDEVERLLEAAQDEMMLKLSVDTHMSRVSPDYLPSDLHRRFRALKSTPSVPPPSSHGQNLDQPPRSSDQDAESKAVSDANLFARFAALKASLPSSSASGYDRADQKKEGGEDDGDGEDEAEKVIRWAMDAARLDPSPPSDDEDDHDHSSSEDDDDDDDDDDDCR